MGKRKLSFTFLVARLIRDQRVKGSAVFAMHHLGKVALDAAVSGLVKEGISAAVRAATKPREKTPSPAAQTNRMGAEGIVEALKCTVDHSIKLQLDPVVTRDLRTSICAFNEGYSYMCKVFKEVSPSKVGEISAFSRGKPPRNDSLSAPNIAWIEVLNMAKDLKSLHKSASRALCDAKERFDCARKRATEAFCNEALSVTQRALAMRYRVAATILANIDHPADALPALMSCLEDLHSTEVIQRYFANDNADIRRDVRELHIVICDVTQVCGGGALLTWPCLNVGGQSIDPLHADRSLEHCCETSCFGQNEEEEEHNLKFAFCIASNSKGQILVGDRVDRNIKVFDETGVFLSCLDPFAHELKTELREHEIWNVTCDQQDNVLILSLIRNQSGEALSNKIFVFEKCGRLTRKFPLTEGFRGNSLTVDDFNQVLVAGGTFTDMCNDLVEVYQRDGEFFQRFGKEILYNAQDIAAAYGGNLLVLDADEGFSFIRFFDAQGQHLFRVSVRLPSPDAGYAVAFHRASEKILIASLQSENRVVVYMYSESLEFVRAIQFKSKAGPFITGVAATTNGRIAVPCGNKVLLA